jgi:DNA-binding NarL/FixJ family response regulator
MTREYDNLSTSPSRHRALIVGESVDWLKQTAEVLSGLEVEVIGAETTATAALRVVERRLPDLLVVHLGAPTGLECIRHVRERGSRTLRVIAFGGSDDREQIDAAFAAGASAYVVETADSGAIAAAIRQAFAQSLHFPNGVEGGGYRVRPEPFETPPLTPREHEVLRLIAEGHTNAQIARKLEVTSQTVKFHLSNIYAKLRVEDRADARRWAQAQGLVSGSATACDTREARHVRLGRG